MAAIREPGPINDHTYLIDAIHDGISGGYAVYLLKSKSGRTCLIDAGTKESARLIYERLKALDAWPLDRIIITHSHWDHTQGIGFLREKAAETGDTIEIMASEIALPFLADQSYNVCFGTDQAPYLNITNVTPLKDGDRLDIDKELSLKILATPGHMDDHISIVDLSNRNIFVGDAIGMKWIDDFTVSNPNSPYWKEEDFLRTIARLKKVDYTSLCLAHFGCLTGDEAIQFPDESLSMYRQWMSIFAENRERIEDITFLAELMWKQIYPLAPEEFKPLLFPGLEDAVEHAARTYQIVNENKGS
jgi:glyoxylase-like metal-dependent hydrolase (beta-lactamase superfamily II)